MPLISIVVPVYKVKEDYLRQCLDSLVGQTFKNIEIILVDDGTPDNGGVICDQYASLDKRIKVIHQKNQGVSAARNNGMKVATGEWITFVDADDWIELDSCEKMIEVLKYQDIDILIFGIKLNLSNKVIENSFWDRENTILNKEEIDELQLQIIHKSASRYNPPNVMVGVAVCKLYKTTFIKENGLEFNNRLSYAEDRVFAFLAMEYAKKVIYIDEHLYSYRNHSESVTHAFRENAIMENDKGLKELEKCLDKFRKGDNFYKALYQRAILSIFILNNQFYCHKKNNMSFREKRKSIKTLCKSEPYLSAIKKSSIKQNSRQSTLFQKYGLHLLKIHLYSIFYLSCSLKEKYVQLSRVKDVK